MPFVRVVDRKPWLAHQIYLSISQADNDYIISCQCMPVCGAGREEIGRVTYKEIVESNGRGTQLVMMAWKLGRHNPDAPPFDDEAIAAATSSRWTWVDLGPQPDAAGAEQP